MKNVIQFIDKNKWFLLVIIVVSAAFYWYEWRPAQVEKECSALALGGAKKSGSYGQVAEVQGLCVSSGGVDNFMDVLK